ncbi:MAG: Gfo/Idh/MocA family protein [Bryobacteraceae bacterium]
MNRRFFIGAAAAASRAAASDQVNIAIVGVRGRGRALASTFMAVPDVRISYLVDVDPQSVGPALEMIEKKTDRKPAVVSDLRRALDDKSLNAIVVATPDHWHAPATILACDAGKDVYVEKPASHNIREGRLMVEAARRNRRVVQHGTQGRSRPNTIRAVEYARSGKIGKLYMAKAWNVQKRRHIGHQPDSAPPPGLDYDIWVGPALWMPFNQNRFHYNWHWHWNFGTGDMGNDGAHQVDQARWALGVDYPVEVSGMGRKLYFDDDQQTPDTMVVVFNYPDKALMFEQRIWNPYKMDGVDNGVAIYGADGMVQIGRWKDGSGFKVFDSKGEVVHFDKEGTGDGEHARNFIECVRTRKAPNAEIEIGHMSTVHCLLGNIVARTGRTLKFDARTETIAGDAEANKLIGRQYRGHWATPKGA